MNCIVCLTKIRSTRRTEQNDMPKRSTKIAKKVREVLEKPRNAPNYRPNQFRSRLMI